MIRFLRLEVSHFAAVESVAIEFGPGLNVLYGPNDLGKSTIADSIRLALLLPHNSSLAQEYIPWRSGGDPTVELTFTTGPQRIHRVRKRFGPRGSSLLQESRNGIEFEDVETGRGVDGALRRLLGWGILEPGGAERTHGLPESFLATALLSTQRDVNEILGRDLKDDKSGTGKDQIAKALQTVAQNPRFLALLHQVRQKRDLAFTDTGRKRKGTVFSERAERVNEAREEVIRWTKVVSDAESAVEKLRQLSLERETVDAKLGPAEEYRDSLAALVEQTTRRAAALAILKASEEEVNRIRTLNQDVADGEQRLAQLTQQVSARIRTHEEAEKQQRDAQQAVAAAQAALLAQRSASAAGDKQTQARKDEIAKALRELEPQVAELGRVQALVQTVLDTGKDLKARELAAAQAGEALAAARKAEQAAADGLAHCGLLENMFEVLSAEQQLQGAREQVQRKADLEALYRQALEQNERLSVERAAIVVPLTQQLGSMRKLAYDLGVARGAMEVGLLAKVTPLRAVDLGVRSDQGPVETRSTHSPWDLEARGELELTFAGIATVQIMGGSRDQQQRVAALEGEWNRDVRPHLQAAGVDDFEALEGKVAAARELDASLRTQQQQIATIGLQMSDLRGAEDALAQADQAATTARATLGTVDQAGLQAELAALGLQTATKLRSRRTQAQAALETAKSRTSQAAQAFAVAEDRMRQCYAHMEAAVQMRDAAMAPYPQGIDAAVAAAEKEQATLRNQEQNLVAEQARQAELLLRRVNQLEQALKDAQAREATARVAVTVANSNREESVTAQASQEGNLRALRKQRDAANLPLAEQALQRAAEALQLLPVPGQIVTDADLARANAQVDDLVKQLVSLRSEIDRAHGALEQTGGSVARERLADAEEALRIAEQREKETEDEYEAWKLLLEQMKEADAAQASNLGLALSPVVADRFADLTLRRYGNVELSAGLATKGIVAAGSVRSTDLLSVGTRDQLSTLFRLALAEYLQTAVVLDDQLAQSDEVRMRWFRGLLYEKASQFQIIVLTCRPEDYLAADALVPEDGTTHVDLQDYPVRAVFLARTLRRHT